MPVVWKLEKGVVVVSLIGDCERRHLKAALEAAIRDPRVRPGTAVLVDARSSIAYSFASMGEDELRWRVDMFAAFAGRGLGQRIALVAAPSASRVGTAMRAAAMMREGGQDFQWFVDRGDAEQWLRQDASATSRVTTPRPTRSTSSPSPSI